MKYLAHWIFTDEDLQTGVTEQALIKKATEYLCPRRFEDIDEARSAAQQFIDFCRGRAWVFTDSGTTKDGERLYQFTHRTFLEYFTAAHLVRVYPTADRLAEILIPRISRREWDVVSQLAFQLLNKNVEGAGDELLQSMIQTDTELSSLVCCNRLAFAAGCLEFVVPSPRVTREVVKSCVEFSIARGVERFNRGSKGHNDQALLGGASELLSPLFSAAEENQAVIADALSKLATERITGNNPPEAILAFELVMFACRFSQLGRNPVLPRRGAVEHRSLVFRQLVKAHQDRLIELSRSDLGLCIEAHWRDMVTVRDIVDWHSVEGLFLSTPTRLVSGGRVSIAESLLDSIVRERYRGGEFPHSDCRQALAQVGHVLLATATPWLAWSKRAFPLALGRRLRGERESQSAALDGDASFGAFCLLAVLAELSQRDTDQGMSALGLGRVVQVGLVPPLQDILLSRLGRGEDKDMRSALSQCELTTDQADFALRWARAEINLVKPRRRRGSETSRPRTQPAIKMNSLPDINATKSLF